MTIKLTLRNKYFLILTILFVWIITSALPYAQEQPDQQSVTEETEKSNFIKVSEIPQKLEENSLYIQNLKILIESSTDSTLTDSSWNNYLQRKADLQNAVDINNLDNYYTRKLDDTQRRWSKRAEQISIWQSIVKEKITKLEEEKTNLEDKKGIWQKTQENAIKEEAPPELLQNITEIITEFHNYLEKIGVLVNEKLKIQNTLADENIASGIIISKLKTELSNRKQEIFSQDSAPLWEVFSGRKDSVSISNQMGDIWSLYKRSANEFVEINKKNLTVDLLALLFLLLLVLGLKNFSKKLEDSDNSLTIAFKLLERPFSVTVLIFLLLFVLLYPEIPEILVSFIKFLAIIPLLRILLHIAHKSFALPLIGISLLFVLSEIQGISTTESQLERIVLFLLTFLAFAGFLWLIIKKPILPAIKGKSGEGLIWSGINIATLLFAISLVANILGYVSLAQILVVKTLSSIFIAIIFITASIILTALLNIYLLTKFAKRLRIIQNFPDKVRNTTNKIIKYAFIFYWILILIRAFESLFPIEEYFTELFTRQWTIGTFSISIAEVALFFITIWVSVLLARLIRFTLEGEILSRMTLPRGVPGAIGTLVKYLIVGFGILVAFSAAGLGLDKFTLIAGALGVGIGFGLQDLVRNFISGLILIFERPIQIGDAIQIDDVSGLASKIGIRSTIIKTWDGAEVIVPNGNLIANKLVNWTMTDRLRRIEIKVGVSYGTDVALVMQTLLKCAKDHQQILTNPASSVLFNDFAESYLEFELRCWTSHYSDWVTIRSDIRVAIDEAFDKEGIVIPFPQRDLHIISNITQDETKEKDFTDKRKKLEKTDKEEKPKDLNE